MFFSERLLSIKNSDKVLEVGPGGLPHPRSDVFLELKFDSEEEEKKQRGNADKPEYNKPVIYYDGKTFPFKDDEFDYIICSHVLEHVENVDEFLSELKRVAPNGYIEYPRIYYDYLYNFIPHKNFILKKGNTIFWMTKEESGFNKFAPVHAFFQNYNSKGFFANDLLNLKDAFFEGFEWFRDNITSQKTSDIENVCIKVSKDDFDNNFTQMQYIDILRNNFHTYRKHLYKQFKHKPVKFIRNLFSGKLGF